MDWSRIGSASLMVPLEVAVRAEAQLAEGPVWDVANRTLVWVDIHAGLVHRGNATLDVGQPVGAVAPRVGGGLVLALRDGFALMDADGESLEVVAAVEPDLPRNRMNDGRCDPAGRFWAGTMNEEDGRRDGALYRLGTDLRVTRMLEGVGISNGIDWSPDATIMYHVDTPTQRVDAFDFDLASGELANRDTLIEIAPEDGAPDGLTVDAEGSLWLALWGGSALRRYAPSGALEQEVRFPVSRVTSCAFGGPGLRDLYVTTARQGLSARELEDEPLAGSIFRLRTDVNGRPPNRFAA